MQSYKKMSAEQKELILFLCRMQVTSPFLWQSDKKMRENPIIFGLFRIQSNLGEA